MRPAQPATSILIVTVNISRLQRIAICFLSSGDSYITTGVDGDLVVGQCRQYGKQSRFCSTGSAFLSVGL
jgi:hypothetical protein